MPLTIMKVSARIIELIEKEGRDPGEVQVHPNREGAFDIVMPEIGWRAEYSGRLVRMTGNPTEAEKAERQRQGLLKETAETVAGNYPREPKT